MTESTTQSDGSAPSFETSSGNGSQRSVRQTVRQKVLPRFRKIGKVYVNDLKLKNHEKLIAEGLIDLGANILDSILNDSPRPEPVPNPAKAMTESELMDELARRTGRRIILAPQEAAETPRSPSETDAT